MGHKRTNLLRAYHLLVLREIEGFTWQVRYGRFANPIERSLQSYPTHDAAERVGSEILKKHQTAAQGSTEA